MATEGPAAVPPGIPAESQTVNVNMGELLSQFMKLQQEMAVLKTQVEAQEHLKDEVKQLKQQLKDVETKSAHNHDDMPKMNVKLIDKPEKFVGDGWTEWEPTFVNSLKRSDMRWKAVLKEIAAKSDKPLDDKATQEIREAVGLVRDDVYDEFQEQLYEYLKTYTTGDINTSIIAGGPTKSFEAWRRLSDQGRSIRTRPLRDEKRALYHPKQATLENLMQSIASWEKRYGAYVKQCPSDAIEEQEKIMCLEDICPEVVQRYLSEKAQHNGLKTYDEYKDAIDQYFHEQKRWSKGTKLKLNLCCDDTNDDPGNNEEDEAQEQYVDGNDLNLDQLWGEINALVKTKLLKPKFEGKGGRKGAPGGGKKRWQRQWFRSAAGYAS